MANPFGIEQVNVPGLLGMHAQQKQQRLQDLYMARKMEQEDRALQKEERIAGAISKLYTGTPKAPTSGVETVPSAAPVAPAQPVQPLSQQEGDAIIARASETKTITPIEADRVRRSLGPNGTAAYEKWMTDNGITIEGQGGPEVAQPALPPLDQDLPPRTDGMKINQEALRELFALNPEMALKIQKSVYDADKQGLELMSQRGEAMATAATALQNVPASQRPAELQRWGQYLVERGYSPDMLAQVDLSDAGLERYVTQGRKIENIITSNKPDLRVIPMGGTLYDVSKNRNVSSNAPQAGQVVDGYRYNGGDLNDKSSWEKVN